MREQMIAPHDLACPECGAGIGEECRTLVSYDNPYPEESLGSGAFHAVRRLLAEQRFFREQGQGRSITRK